MRRECSTSESKRRAMIFLAKIFTVRMMIANERERGMLARLPERRLLKSRTMVNVITAMRRWNLSFASMDRGGMVGL